MTPDRLSPLPIVHPEWYPYQHLVPRDRAANLRWRKEVNRRCRNSKSDRLAIMEMCRRDLLFFINGFTWVYSPLLFPDCPDQPFVSWAAQDGMISEIHAAIAGQYRLGLWKSRDQGMSIMNLEVDRWYFIFSNVRRSFLVFSREATQVDDGNNTDSLFWKLDFAMSATPKWMLPDDLERTSMEWFNPLTKVVINGATTTEEIARGGRRTAIFGDEYNAVPHRKASLALKAMQFAARCTILNGTFDADSIGHPFEWVIKKSNWRKAAIWWEQNPFHAEGLYKDKAGKSRSKWYDKQVDEAMNKGTIAGELDGDPYAASQPFYAAPLIDACLSKCREPMVRGELVFTAGKGELVFRETDDGPWWLWFLPDKGQVPDLHHSFSQGADTGQGTGATPSCIAVYDAMTGELMAEYRCNTIDPTDFGRMALASHRWFSRGDEGSCYSVIEANGAGRSTIRVFTEAGCNESELHYRRKEDSDHDDPTLKPGWWASPRSKFDLHDAYRTALKEGKIQTWSKETIGELREFRHLKNTVVHSRAVNSMDPSAADENHGDMGTATALANLGIHYCEEQKIEEKYIPETSFYARRKQWQKQHSRKQRWSQRIRSRA